MGPCRKNSPFTVTVPNHPTPIIFCDPFIADHLPSTLRYGTSQLFGFTLMEHLVHAHINQLAPHSTHQILQRHITTTKAHITNSAPWLGSRRKYAHTTTHLALVCYTFLGKRHPAGHSTTAPPKIAITTHEYPIIRPCAGRTTYSFT
jgi:hypothetical protein